MGWVVGEEGEHFHPGSDVREIMGEIREQLFLAPRLKYDFLDVLHTNHLKGA